MKKIITQNYADDMSIRQPLVGKVVDIVGHDRNTILGRIEGEKQIRSFRQEDLQSLSRPELDDDMVKCTFKHFPPNEHHKQYTWDLYVEGDTRRLALRNENQQIAYVRLDLDWGEQSFHKPQTRRIPKSALPLLTDREAARNYIDAHQTLFGVSETPAQRQRVSYEG